MVSREEVAAVVDEMAPLSNVFLPYSSYEEEKGVFFLSDFSIGMAWEMTPKAASHLSGSQKDQIAKRIASAFSRLDDYVSVQFIAIPSAIVEDEVDNYRKQAGTTNRMLDKIHNAKSSFVEDGTHGLNVPIGDIDFKTKKIRIMVTLVVRATETSTSAFSSIKDAVFKKIFRKKATAAEGAELPAMERFSNDFGKLYRQLMKNVVQFEGVFKSNGMTLNRLGTEQFIRLVRNQVQLKTGPTDKVVFDPSVPISEQIVNKEIRYDQDKGHVYCDEMYHKLLSISSMPNYTYTGILSEPNENLGFFTLFDYIVDGILVVNIYAKPRAIVAAELEKRVSVATRNSGNKHKQEQVLEDLKLAQQWTIQEGRRLLEVTTTVSMADENPKRANLAIEKLQAKMAEVGFRARIEETPAPSLWLQQLPFGYKPSAPEARRSRPLVDLAVADMLPIYLMGRGTKSNTMMSFNRLGEPFGWDPFDSNTGFHFAVFGQSGAGKSFRLNSMMLDFLSNDRRKVFIIDKGRSFVQTVGLAGDEGQFCNISLRDKTCMNVFAGTYTMAGAFLGSWIPYLCERSDADALDQETFGMLEDMLRQTYDSKKDFDVPYRFRSDFDKDYEIDRSSWIDIMRKRIHANMLDDYVLTDLNSLKETDSANVPQFDIYFKVYLKGRQREVMNKEKGFMMKAFEAAKKGEPVRDHRIVDGQDFGSIQEANVEVDPAIGSYVFQNEGTVYEASLRDQTVKIQGVKDAAMLWDYDLNSLTRTYAYVESDDHGLYVLATSRNAARTLKADGWDIELVEDYLVVEAAERHDIETLFSRGLRCVFPKSYVDENRRHITSRIKTEQPLMEDAILQDLVEAELRSLSGGDYFDTVVGKGTIQREVMFRDLAQRLEQSDDPAMQKMYRQLSPYHGGGVYAGFFDGPTEFDLSAKRVICWECGELFSAGMQIVGAVLGALFQMITIYSQSRDGLKYQKMCVIDEFREFLKAPIAVEFTETTLRQGRKHNLAMGIATQSVTDLATGDARKLLELIQFTIIGLQKPEVVADLPDLIKFTPEQTALADSCVTDKGVYSEFMIVNNDMGLCEVERLIAPPILYWAFSTDPKDRDMRDEKTREFQMAGKSAEDARIAALDECARLYPKGVARGQQVVI